MDTLAADLTRLFGHTEFRAGQREIVEAALAGRDTLAILPTGGGKSLTYQLPAMLLPGATLILSPLIALMKDQTENMPPEVAAQTALINSSLDPSEAGKRLARLRDGKLKVVYAAPERLRQPPFLHALRTAGLSLIVIDEAHCISQWGHDFRPDYRAVGQAVQSLNPRSVLAVTATATPEVQADIEAQLGRKLERMVRPTWRENLYLVAKKVKGEDDKLWATLELCQAFEGAGLVYCQSREKCEQLARMLKRQGIAADFYHAGLPAEERAAAQDRFMSGEIRVMTATVAFGMGVDKSDIRFLIHYHPSRSLENYYQEAGRAGRDGAPSTCVLMHSSSDAAGATRRLNEDALTLERLRSVYNAVKSAMNGRRLAPVGFEAISAGVDGDDGLVRQGLPVLEEQGLIRRHTDIPRRMSIYGDSFFEESSPELSDDPLAQAFEGVSGDYDPLSLAERVGIPLPELEEAVLRLQDAGRLTYRGSARSLLLELVPPPPDSKVRMEQTLLHRAEGQASRRDAMRDYARVDRCRHQQIARYFGDAWPRKNCGVCDVCAPKHSSAPRQIVKNNIGPDTSVSNLDGPLAALTIVHDLASARSPFALGKSGLVRALRGTPDAPIRPDRSAGFGALSGWKKVEVERLCDALADKGLLRRDDEDEYRRLYLTEEGQDAVRSGACDIVWRVEPAGAPSASKDTEIGDADPELLAALKAWRRSVAEEAAMPPYVVFADKTLLGIALRKPANEFQLQEVAGIGPSKAAKYGEAVLALVREHG